MSVGTHKAARRVIRVVDQIVNLCTLLFMLLLLAFGGYAMWDSRQLYNQADAARYDIYKPSAEDEGKSFGELQVLNPDVFAWLTVYGTHIDYPVVQGESNLSYINTNAEGEYALSGSIFLDSKGKRDFSSFNSILYGHHMEKQRMFGDLELFREENYFQIRQYGNLYYDGVDHGLEFFAFAHVDAYDTLAFSTNDFGNNAQNYLNHIFKNAVQLRDIGITAQDRILVLSTCSSESTNGRDLLLARISEQTFEDNFVYDDKKTGEIVTADQQKSLLEQYPALVWFSIPLALTVVAILYISIRRNRRNRYVPRREKLDQ